MSKKKDIIIEDTGEYILLNKPQKFDNGFVQIYRACTDIVIEDLQIDDGRLRLLFWFIKRVQDFVQLNQEPVVLARVKTMAKDLNASVQSIRRWLAVLIERGYIQRHFQGGQVMYNTYVVNKDYIYKGKFRRDT